MISILAQERLLGFALGTVSMGGFVLHQRRAIYRSLADADAAAAGSPFSYQPGEIGSRKSSTDLAHVWNKTVDETLGRLVVYLSSRGWFYVSFLVNLWFYTECVLLVPGTVSSPGVAHRPYPPYYLPSGISAENEDHGAGAGGKYRNIPRRRHPDLLAHMSAEIPFSDRSSGYPPRYVVSD
ncbi:hypothetical protein ABZP36_010242 [Zizania latifolia]